MAVLRGNIVMKPNRRKLRSAQSASIDHMGWFYLAGLFLLGSLSLQACLQPIPFFIVYFDIFY